jgi:uncharacterized protein
MGLTSQDRKALARFRERLLSDFGALEISLFGSKAQGTDTPDSDIDVAVVLRATSPELESAIDDVVYGINLEHGCLIVPVYFSQYELTDGPLGESPLYRRILREGVPL